MKQYFKIGDISKLYQISTDSIRYYEELGLLTPKRGENGYRLYRLTDIWRLNMIRDLRALGFPMEKIRDYLNNRSIHSTERLLCDELDAIQHQISQLLHLQENVEKRLQTIRKAEEGPLETVMEKRFPVRPCHIIRSPYRKDEEMDVLMKQLLNQSRDNLFIIGSNYFGSLLPASASEEGHHRDYEGVFLIADDGPDSFPEGRYLSWLYRGSTEQNAEGIRCLLDYADRHGYRTDDQFLELLWVDIHQSSNPEEFITELQIHILEEPDRLSDSQ